MWPGGPLEQGADPGGFQLPLRAAASVRAAASAGDPSPDAAALLRSSGVLRSPPEDEGEGEESVAAEEDDAQQRRMGGVQGRGGGGANNRPRAADVDLGDTQGLHCDPCDLELTGPLYMCMAEQLFQEPKLQRLKTRHDKKLRTPRGRAADPDRREARHAMYKCVVALRWADPMGAGNPGSSTDVFDETYPPCISQPGVHTWAVRLWRAVRAEPPLHWISDGRRVPRHP